MGVKLFRMKEIHMHVGKTLRPVQSAIITMVKSRSTILRDFKLYDYIEKKNIPIWSKINFFPFPG